jgi:peptidyl-prolyl cis-trans isomerase A (cyclophilin A)
MINLAVCMVLCYVTPGLVQGQASGAAKNVLVRIDTELGTIDAEIDVAHAPVSAANFLRYVDAGLFDGGQFHRSARLETQVERPVKIEVIQASVSDANEAREFPPIRLERTSETGLSHKDGTLSMARSGPDTATSSFSICVGDQPSLDFGGKRNPDGQGFAAFGRVVAGSDVVRKIHAAPAKGEALTPPVRIRSIRRIEQAH